MPFTIDQFLEVFRNYNLTVWPMQIAFYLLGISAIFLAVKKVSRSDEAISAILSFFWLWMGIVYHLIFFTTINKAAYAFGILFIIQGVLFLFLGVLRRRLSFHYRTNTYGVAGAALILFALIVYPVIGYLSSHAYPQSPTFGLPCPTTIFTFGLLLLADRKIPYFVLIIPFLWSLVGATAAISLGIREDLGLLFAGVIATSMIVARNRAEADKRPEDAA